MNSSEGKNMYGLYLQQLQRRGTWTWWWWLGEAREEQQLHQQNTKIVFYVRR